MITIDATNKKVGRLASEIVRLLRGKTSPDFLPYKKPSQKVAVINARRMSVDTRRLSDIHYVRYSGYPGGKKERSVMEIFRHDPSRVLVKAVRGMLPNNKLRSAVLANLSIYNDEKIGKKGK